MTVSFAKDLENLNVLILNSTYGSFSQCSPKVSFKISSIFHIWLIQKIIRSTISGLLQKKPHF